MLQALYDSNLNPTTISSLSHPLDLHVPRVDEVEEVLDDLEVDLGQGDAGEGLLGHAVGVRAGAELRADQLAQERGAWKQYGLYEKNRNFRIKTYEGHNHEKNLDQNVRHIRINKVHMM